MFTCTRIIKYYYMIYDRKLSGNHVLRFLCHYHVFFCITDDVIVISCGLQDNNKENSTLISSLWVEMVHFFHER